MFYWLFVQNGRILLIFSQFSFSSNENEVTLVFSKILLKRHQFTANANKHRGTKCGTESSKLLRPVSTGTQKRLTTVATHEMQWVGLIFCYPSVLGSRLCESDAKPTLSSQILLLLEIFIGIFYHHHWLWWWACVVINNYQIS